MEESRLTPMPTNYDSQLFNQLLNETKPLKIKLAHQINHHRFGVDFEDILSWFDVKFIYVFNKHHGDTPEKIKAYILNAFQNFKCRILRAAYTKKFSQHIVSTEDATETINWLEDEDTNQTKDFYMDKLMEFFKDHLSDNALMLLELQLNPPPFILERINISKDKPLQKIPDSVLLEYLNLGNSERTIKYLARLKKEISEAKQLAKARL